MKNHKVFYGWWVVLGCVLITTTMVPPIMSLSNKFLIQVTTDMNISRSAFTLANTILQGLGIFISPFVSKKLAIGNMKQIQSISIIGFVLSYASYSLAQNAIHLYISAFFIGIFYLNSTIIPVSIMVTNWFVKKRGLAMSLAMAGIGVGGTVFSPIVTMLLNNYGWRRTYQIMALIILVIALPTSLFLLKKRPEDMGLKAYGADEQNLSVKKVNKAIPSVAISISQTKVHIFFWLMLVGMLANGLIAVTGGNVILTMIIILWVSAIVSSFLDNIPFVATLIPLILSMQSHGMNVAPIWWALSLGACLGGNGTLIGASANVVLSGISKNNGHPITFGQYFKIGFPMMLLSIVVCTVFLLIRFA